MGTRECWDVLAEDKVVVVGVVGVFGWVGVVEELIVLQEFEEKTRLRKDQDEERALLGFDGEEWWERPRGETLRFFEKRWTWWSLLVVVKMKQPRWMRRMMKMEKKLLKNVTTLAIGVGAS
jgi:hypothetical protein